MNDLLVAGAVTTVAASKESVRREHL